MVKNYNAIDCMKLLMAILVVAIHTHPLACFGSETLNKYFGLISELAVPFFFITSGFFLYNKIVEAEREQRLARIKKWWKRIVKLYLVWTAIYLPFTIYGFYLDGLTPLKSMIVFLRNVLLVGQNYCSWPLWYLLAMIVAVALIYGMEKMKFSYLLMLTFSVLLTGVGWELDYLNSLHFAPTWWTPIVELYYRLFLHTRNGFFQGLIYLILGIGVAKYKLDMAIKKSLMTFTLFFLLYMVNIPFTLYLVCVSLFVLTKSITMKGDVRFFKNVRQTSTIVYFIHMIFAGLIFSLGYNLNSISAFVIVLLLSLLFSALVLLKREHRWFKLCFE